MILATILASTFAVGALLYVVRPLLAASEPEVPNAGTSRRLALVEERDRAVAAVRELEFDHRTGKLSDRDYRELIGPLRQRAVETLRALESGDRKG
jgi:hypothetical protein